MTTLDIRPFCTSAMMPLANSDHVDLLSPREVAVKLDRPLPTIYWWLKIGRLPAVKVGSRYFVHPSSIRELMVMPPGILFSEETPGTVNSALQPGSDRRFASHLIILKSSADRNVLNRITGIRRFHDKISEALLFATRFPVDFLCCDAAFPSSEIEDLISACTFMNPSLGVLLIQSESPLYPQLTVPCARERTLCICPLSAASNCLDQMMQSGGF